MQQGGNFKQRLPISKICMNPGFLCASPVLLTSDFALQQPSRQGLTATKNVVVFPKTHHNPHDGRVTNNNEERTDSSRFRDNHRRTADYIDETNYEPAGFLLLDCQVDATNGRGSWHARGGNKDRVPT